jgi:sortase A
MTGTWKRWAARLILAIPSFICITGLVLVAVFGWRYLWQTLWVNKRPLPAYEPAPGTARLWPPASKWCGPPKPAYWRRRATRP